MNRQGYNPIPESLLGATKCIDYKLNLRPTPLSSHISVFENENLDVIPITRRNQLIIWIISTICVVVLMMVALTNSYTGNTTVSFKPLTNGRWPIFRNNSHFVPFGSSNIGAELSEATPCKSLCTMPCSLYKNTNIERCCEWAQVADSEWTCPQMTVKTISGDLNCICGTTMVPTAAPSNSPFTEYLIPKDCLIFAFTKGPIRIHEGDARGPVKDGVSCSASTAEALPSDRPSVFRMHIEGVEHGLPIVGVDANAEPPSSTAWTNPTFYGWSAEGNTWEGGEWNTNENGFAGFHDGDEVIFRFDPVSGPSPTLAMLLLRTYSQWSMVLQPGLKYRINVNMYRSKHSLKLQPAEQEDGIRFNSNPNYNT